MTGSCSFEHPLRNKKKIIQAGI